MEFNPSFEVTHHDDGQVSTIVHQFIDMKIGYGQGFYTEDEPMTSIDSIPQDAQPVQVPIFVPTFETNEGKVYEFVFTEQLARQLVKGLIEFSSFCINFHEVHEE